MKLLVSFVVLTTVLFYAIETLLHDVVIAGFTSVTVALVYNLLASALTAKKIIAHGKKGLFLILAGAGITGHFLANNLHFDTLHAKTGYIKANRHLTSVTAMHLSVKYAAEKIINRINEEKKAGKTPEIPKIVFSLFSRNKSGMLAPIQEMQYDTQKDGRLLPLYSGNYTTGEFHIVAIDPGGWGLNPEYRNRNFDTGKPEYEAVITMDNIKFRVLN